MEGKAKRKRTPSSNTDSTEKLKKSSENSGRQGHTREHGYSVRNENICGVCEEQLAEDGDSIHCELCTWNSSQMKMVQTVSGTAMVAKKPYLV